MFNLTKSFNKTIMRKKLLFRSWLLLALMLVGAGSAWAKTKVGETNNALYERGSSTAWAEADLADWTGTGGTASISGGLKVTSTNVNPGWTYTKALNVSEDAVVTVTARLTAGGAPGHNDSYDYLQVGGVVFGFNENQKKAVLIVDGASQDLTTYSKRYDSYDINVVINTLTNAVSYTAAGVSGTATSSTAVESVIFGHHRGGREGYEINPVLNSINVTEVAPVYSFANYVRTWDFSTVSLSTNTDGWTNSATASNRYDKSFSDYSTTSVAGLEDLQFDGTWSLYNSYAMYMKANSTPASSIKIPVTKGQLVTVNGYGDYTRSLTVENASITSIQVTEKTSFTQGMTAQSDGYITITNDNNRDIRLFSITLENAPDVYFSKASCTAELIDLNIDEPTLCYPEGAEVTYSVSNEKIAKLGGEAHSGDLMGVNTGVTTVTATVNYKGSTYTVSYDLTISADEATYVVDGNTYTLTGPGKLGERVVNSIPKISAEFGENGGDVTNITIVRNEPGIGNVATTLDSNGWRQLWYDGSTGYVQPVQGSFYTFKPTSNGRLTVKGYLNGANSVYLVDSENLAHVPSDLTAQVAKDGTYWGGSTPPGEPTPRVNGYKMAEKYELTVATTGNILSQTVSGLANGRYTVVLQANACFTEGRQIKGADGQDYVWDASIANDIANVFVESGGVRQTQAVTALNAGSVSSNGRFEFEVDVTDGTLTMGMNKTQQGTNWHTIQIESLNYLDAADSHFEPVAQYVPGSGFVNNTEVDIVANLEAGKTYYLYANIPSSNGVNSWATYQLQSFTYESAWSFAEKSVVKDFDDVTSYEGMAVNAIEGITPSITYSAEFKGDITGTINPQTGVIESISATGDDADKGGAIIVTATDGTDSDYYVITVPYANHVWDFWGLPRHDTTNYPTDLNEDFDWAVNYEVRTYDDATRNLTYLNEPVLTAAFAVDGDNAAFIGETAGFTVQSSAKQFGLRAESDNLGDYNKFKAFFLDGGTNQAKYAEYIADYGLDQADFTAEKFAELKADGNFVDRYLKIMLAYDRDDVYNTNILAMEKGAVITIPNVKAGSYIALKWYRHAPNTGDRIKLTNAVDLDGVAITTYVNVVNQGRSGTNIFGNPYGWIEFRAAADGDVTLQVDDSGWTHLKAIVLSEDFYDTNLVIRDDNNDKSATTSFNTTDGAVSNTYSRNSYYTKSEQGVGYIYTLKDMTGNVNATTVTIDGGTLTAAQGTVGTATLVLTATSNGFAIDREEIALKFGAYGDTHQDYPYTWNFTNINTGNLDGQENWTKDGDNYTVTPAATTAHLQDNELKKNSTDEDGVAEFDELGIETPTNTDGTPTAIDLTITDNGNSTTTTVGDTGITFVVPEVPEDATVYVKVVPNSNSTVNISNGDGETSPSKKVLSDDTTVYTIDGTPEANDVTVELKNVEIQSIAVTNIFKEARMASASDEFRFYNSDCQAKDIDYDLTDYYTGVEMKAMFITSKSFDEFDYDRETAVVNATPVTAPVSANTGLIVYTEDNEVLHPLFVPDVNTTERENTEGNMLVGVLFNEETGTSSTETLYKEVVTDPGTPYQDLADYKDNIGTFTAAGSSELNSSVRIHLFDTPAIKFANNYNNGANYVEVTCDGGFKRGCIITYSGCISSDDANKTGAIQIYDENGNLLHESQNFVNVYDGSNQMESGGSFQLASDVQSLRIASNGGTATYVTTFRVEWTGSEATTELVETPVTIYTGNVTPAESGTYRYLFTNQYNTVGQDNSLTSDEPGFYRLKEAGGKLKSNRAYLVIGQNVLKGNSVKAVYLKSFFNDDPDDDFSTVIELVDGNNAGIDMNGTFYTISGVKIQGMPTKSGIYIQNGKKIMVK